MPLKLLPHKSWNPYSSAAIARVESDVAAVESAKRRHAELIANYQSRRTAAQLRGEAEPSPPPSLEECTASELSASTRVRSDVENGRSLAVHKIKRRRLPGEDDTDRDIRLASRESTSSFHLARRDDGRQKRRRKEENDPLIDGAGHFSLFPARNGQPQGHREDRQRDIRARRSKAEDSDRQPWYIEASRQNVGGSGSGEDGEEQAVKRLVKTPLLTSQNDPLAAMKHAQEKIREQKMDVNKSLRMPERALEHRSRENRGRSSKTHSRHHHGEK